MIERTYLCDLCRTAKDLEGLVAIKWITKNGTETIVRDHQPYQCEHHVCKDCLLALKELV